jgi:hypothetical protein
MNDKTVIGSAQGILKFFQMMATGLNISLGLKR